MGVLLWRDFPLRSVMGQCFGNEQDSSGKGRQMPVVGRIIAIRPGCRRVKLTTPFLKAFRFQRTPLPHNLLPARDANPPGSRRRIRA